MTSYKLHNDLRDGQYIERIDAEGVSWSIPFDPANTDYQAYLAWLAEGNEPEPADTQGEQ